MLIDKRRVKIGINFGGGREKKSFSLKIGEKRKEEKVFCGSEASNNSLLPSARPRLHLTEGQVPTSMLLPDSDARRLRVTPIAPPVPSP